MEKINVAELLKDCPKGMELDCTMWDNVTLEVVCDGDVYPIRISTPEGQCSLSQYGCCSLCKESKCIIFPKGKTTWEGFHKPFEDGDIIYTKTKGNDKWLSIYKRLEGRIIRTYVDISFDKDMSFYCNLLSGNILCYKEGVTEQRLATEEEKQKLFDIIKENGYKWNAETKTLEKLAEPIFKVGDKIKHKNGKDKNGVEQGLILFITDDAYDVAVTNDMGIFVPIADQDNWELIPNKFDISTLVPFESRVLTRDDGYSIWQPSVWGLYDEGHKYPYITTGVRYRYCIPYEGNAHLLGKTDDCDNFYKTWEE